VKFRDPTDSTCFVDAASITTPDAADAAVRDLAASRPHLVQQTPAAATTDDAFARYASQARCLATTPRRRRGGVEACRGGRGSLCPVPSRVRVLPWRRLGTRRDSRHRRYTEGVRIDIHSLGQRVVLLLCCDRCKGGSEPSDWPSRRSWSRCRRLRPLRRRRRRRGGIVPLLTLCTACGQAMPRGGGARCAECAAAHRRQTTARRNKRPQIRFWTSPEWRRVRAEVIRRDGDECRRCGSRERLTVHHETYAAPLDPTTCVTLCARCHGSESGLISGGGRRAPDSAGRSRAGNSRPTWPRRCTDKALGSG